MNQIRNQYYVLIVMSVYDEQTRNNVKKNRILIVISMTVNDARLNGVVKR